MSNRGKSIVLFLSDSFVLFLGFTLAVRSHFYIFAFVFPLCILGYFTEGLYTLETFNPGNLSQSLLRGTAFSTILSLIFMTLLPEKFSGLSITSIVIFALVVPYMLHLARLSIFELFSRKELARNTLLIGSGSTLQLARDELRQKPFLGYRIMASLSPEEAQLHAIDRRIHLIAIDRKSIRDGALYKKIFPLLGSGIEIMDLAHFTENVAGKIPLESIDETWFIEHCGRPSSILYDYGKSFIDRSLALLMLLLLIPVAMILLPILLIIQGRPLFYKQTRTGLNNIPFTLYKLRTMVMDAEKNGIQWSQPGDARITPVGNFLRKTRLDELPQLYNILKGEMSLVGPRPERPEIIDSQLAIQIPYFNLRHLVKPGVTGWAQVTFRYGFSLNDSREKLQYDLFYVKNRSLWLDVRIILKTIKTVLTGAGQ